MINELTTGHEWSSQGKSEQTKGRLLHFAAKHPELELGRITSLFWKAYTQWKQSLINFMAYYGQMVLTTEVKALDCKSTDPYELERVVNTETSLSVIS